MNGRDIRVLFCVVSLLTSMWSCASPSPEPIEADETSKKLEELLTVYEKYGFSGSVIVSKGGEVVFEGGYGYTNRATAERNTPETRYDFASIAKTFTGAAVLALEAEGLLAVDDRLEKHVGPFPEQKASATIRHLATHTAGLAHRSKSELDYSEDRTAYIQSMKDAPFETAPGSSYRYTNAGASLLGAVVEEVAGERFEQVVQERLFEPAGMTATGFYPDYEPGEPGLARGYGDESSTPAPSEYEGWTWGAIGATGIVSTVRDIHTWYQALSGGEVLPPEQTAQLFDFEEEEAFGWHAETNDQGRTFIHKGGGLAAMQSQILAYPDQGVVVVWAHNNMARNWRRALNRGIAAVALGDPFVMPPDVAGPGASAPDLEGWWQTEGGTRIELVETGEGLGVGGNGFGLPAGLLHAGADGAWVSFDVERVSSFVLGAEGEAAWINLEPEGERLALTRTDGTEPAILKLDEPTDQALEFARSAAEWILGADVEQAWSASVYRPVRGSYSRAGWSERFDFISNRVGGEVRLIEEAWVLSEGSWRYWRTFESSAGMEIVIRLGVSADRKLLSFGINPRGSTPDFEERRVVSPAR